MNRLTHHPQSLEQLKARLPAALVPWSYSKMMEYYRRGVGLPNENIFDFEDGLRIQVSVKAEMASGISISFLHISASPKPGGGFMLRFPVATTTFEQAVAAIRDRISQLFDLPFRVRPPDHRGETKGTPQWFFPWADGKPEWDKIALEDK